MDDVLRVERMRRRNGPLLRKVGDVIADVPDRYDQRVLYRPDACGTTACIAGHTALLTHGDLVDVGSGTVALSGGVLGCHLVHADDLGCHFAHADEVAEMELGLTSEEANELFRAGWRPAGACDMRMPLHELVRDALYALADGATVDEVTASGAGDG